jgi:EAL domain-containing protein (putative c-di-GMP-specific phosphodiesterase class I)
LAELKPRFIKLDMSIVRDADRLSHKQRLIDLLCRFADATDALLVAEGIETEAEATTVRECGAHLLQGYLIGRPRLPAALRVVASEVDDQRDAG